MNYFKIYHKFLLLFFILMVNACNTIKPKLVVDANSSMQSLGKESLDGIAVKTNKSFSSQKVSKKVINLRKEKDSIKSDQSGETGTFKSNHSDVIFEFKNETLLQGREKPISKKVIKKTKILKKTDKALSAVFKMLNKDLINENKNLKLKKDNKVTYDIDYTLKLPTTKNSLNFKKILVFLPFTGPYSTFATKIRKSIDLSILKFGEKNIKIIYFDSGSKFNETELKKLLINLDPQIIIGPFSRSSLLKIKSIIQSKPIPIFTFSNDIALVENKVWSLGFSPEEQIESVISCAVNQGFKRFGIIAPDNLYGKIIFDRSIDIIGAKKSTNFSKLLLSNSQMNNKKKLSFALKSFLNFDQKNNGIHDKFDAILLGGSKKFIIEIAPLLAFYDVDAKYIQILGTEKFNVKEIKNEPSLEGAWFPKVSSRNFNDFEMIFNESWDLEDDYFSRIGFDVSMLAIDFLNQEDDLYTFLKDYKGLVTGFSFKSNGFVKKPTSIMKIEKLGKLKRLTNCDNF